MGQYYYCVFLAEDGKYIRAWLDPLAHNNGMKLLEHSYVKNNFMLAVESNLGPNGAFYMSRAVWAGDYAEPEAGSDTNLYTMCLDQKNKAIGPSHDAHEYSLIINHSKKLIIDKTTLGKKYGLLHPLPLLTSEGNGNSGGDYSGPNKELCGTWVRDIISMNDYAPLDYEQFVPEFSLEEQFPS
jgi:hypothetical protein